MWPSVLYIKTGRRVWPTAYCSRAFRDIGRVLDSNILPSACKPLVMLLFTLFTLSFVFVSYGLPHSNTRAQLKQVLGSQDRSTPAPRQSSQQKYVVAHHMVGNTFPYTIDDWKADISLAKSNGIDGFALNLGSEDWQSARVQDA